MRRVALRTVAAVIRRVALCTVAAVIALIGCAATPRPARTVTIVAAGDIAPAGGPGASVGTAAIIDRSRPSAVLALGDTQYPDGAYSAYLESYAASWGAFRAITRPAVGNHEYETPGAAGYRQFFGDAAAPEGTTYYSYDLGAWHLIALDSNCDVVLCSVGSPQLDWLEADLARDDHLCELAYWHHPRFSSGTSHGGTEEVRPFWDALYAAGADVILSAHEHNYERFAKQDGSGAPQPASGIRQFVVGTGGAHLYPFSTPEANSEVRLRTHGVLEMRLRPASYDWRFVEAGGGIADAGISAPCH
jgi:hypothetical protein